MHYIVLAVVTVIKTYSGLGYFNESWENNLLPGGQTWLLQGESLLDMRIHAPQLWENNFCWLIKVLEETKLEYYRPKALEEHIYI